MDLWIGLEVRVFKVVVKVGKLYILYIKFKVEFEFVRECMCRYYKNK